MTRRTRAPLVGGAAVTGLVGVLAAHALGGSSATVGLAPATSGAAPASGASPTSSGATTSTSSPAASSTTSPPATTGTGSSTTTTTPAASGARSATGALEQYGYGEIEVRVTTEGGKITDVTVVELRTAESFSANLAAEALPTLRNEVLADQSAHISTVSGATYTSDAYASSVQAALDSLGIA